MARVVCRRSSERVYVEIAGEACLQHVPKVQDFLLGLSRGNTPRCVVDLNRITEIDFSFAELMLSFFVTMKKAEKPVTFVSLKENHPVMLFLSHIGIPNSYLFGQE